MSKTWRLPLLLAALGTAGWLVATEQSPAPAAASLSLPTRPLDAKAMPTPVASPSNGHSLPMLMPREQLIAPAAADAQATARRDLFSARSWTPPPPPQPVRVEAAPAAVVTPPPYAVLGKLKDADGWQVFLARGELTLVARVGAVLEGSYQVTLIDPPRLVLTHLPMGQTQELAIGEAR